jgi:uncharacterized protein (DUF4415 family)
MARRSASSARGGRAGNAVPTRRTGHSTDFSDIRETSPAQLKTMRRVGRPPLGAAARRLIAIRLDPSVLAALRRDAKRQGLPYQSLINTVLARYVVRPRRSAARRVAAMP